MVCMSGTTGQTPQDAQKVRPARPQRVKGRAYPLGYVEGLNDARTPREDCFSILLGPHVDDVSHSQMDDLRRSRAWLGRLWSHAQGSILADSFGKPYDHLSIG